MTVLPLVVWVAVQGTSPVVPEGWIDTQVREANRIYAPHGIQFRVQERRELPEKHSALENRTDRDALGTFFAGPAIHWFVVASLRDVDDPKVMRRGVHWRPSTRPGHRLVIVSAVAKPWVLAHELGHFLGLRQHPDETDNVMSYSHTDKPPFLREDQGARCRKAVRRLLRTGQVRPIPAEGPHP